MKPIVKALLRKKRKKESWFKYIMSVSHLWLGLLSSIVLVIICLSGSIYAFKNQVEDLANYGNVHVDEVAKQSFHLDSIVNHFELNFGKPSRVTLYEPTKCSVEVAIASRQGGGITAYYHPQTGKFLGTKGLGTPAFFAFILQLHRFLLAGEIGKTINGIAVLIFTYMLFSGFILWLPKKLKQLKNGLVVRWKARFYRLNYDLHKVLGFYSLLLLFFIAATGLYVSFHWVKNLIIVGLGGNSIVISENNTSIKEDLSASFNELFTDLKSDTITQEKSVSLQAIYHQINQRLAYKGTTVIGFPNEQQSVYRVTKFNRHNALNFYLPDKLEITSGGVVRKAVQFSSLPLHEQFKAIAKPLHTGEIMGLGSIILYFLVSFIGCTLPITGFIIWWKRIK